MTIVHRLLRAAALVALVATLTVQAVAARPPPAAPPLAIDYQVRRLPSADRYEITLRFRGESSGRSTLTIPTAWASATQAERGIEDLAVLTPGARLEDTDAPQTKRIVHRPDALLTVRYVLKQIADGEPAATSTTQYLPVIQRGYFEWIGWTTWVTPVSDNRRPVHVHLAFRNLPPGWTFASSFGLDPTAVDFDGPMQRFQSAVFLGGDFRLRARPARGGPVITAMRGDWSFGDNALADRVARIVEAERAFWNDDAQPYYLIALLPLATERGIRTSTGTGLSQSFVTFVTPNTPLDALDFLWAHEYFHTWNSGQLGAFPQPEAQLYWFSEGFTDYFSNLMQVRVGWMTLAQYAQHYDDAIRFLAESPEGRAPNSEVVERFFTDGRSIGRLPYYRGMLLAAQWNAEIVAASGGARSLDDAMRTLREQHGRGTETLDAQRIADVMTSYGVRDAAGDIDRQIERGALPRLAEAVLTPCIAIDDVTAPRDDIGFDLAGSTKGGPIVGVDPTGPAWAAGLRNGQYLRSFAPIDRTEHLVEAEFQDTRDGDVRTIRYRSLGRALTRQHVTVVAGLDDDARRACLTSLGVPPRRE